jgi:hypothetical protein
MKDELEIRKEAQRVLELGVLIFGMESEWALDLGVANSRELLQMEYARL